MTMSAALEKASRPSGNAQLPPLQRGDVAKGEERRDALSDGDRSRRRAASPQRPAQPVPSTPLRGKNSGIGPIARTRNGTVAAFTTAIARTDIASASTSMSKRVPKADAVPGGVPLSNRCHRHDNGTGDLGEHPFRRAARSGIYRRTAIRKASRPNQSYPVRRARRGCGWWGSEPALERPTASPGGAYAGCRGHDAYSVAKDEKEHSRYGEPNADKYRTSLAHKMQERPTKSRRSASTSLRVRCIWRPCPSGTQSTSGRPPGSSEIGIIPPGFKRMLGASRAIRSGGQPCSPRARRSRRGPARS